MQLKHPSTSSGWNSFLDGLLSVSVFEHGINPNTDERAYSILHKYSQLPTVKELQRRINRLLDEDSCLDNIRREILRNIKYARMMNDIGKVSDLRMILGNLYLHTSETSKAGKRFRMVLRDDPNSIDAIMGIAESYGFSCRNAESRKWLEKARVLAENTNDNAKLIEILDKIAWQAITFQHDFSGLDDLYSKMCSLLENTPKMDNIPLSSVLFLLLENKTSYAIPYLESLIKYFVSKGSSRGAMQIVFRYYVETKRRMGISDDVIMDELKTFEHLAPNEIGLRSFTEISERAFRANQYPVFP